MAFVTVQATVNQHRSQNTPAGTNNIIIVTEVTTDTVTAQQQSTQQHLNANTDTIRTPDKIHTSLASALTTSVQSALPQYHSTP